MNKTIAIREHQYHIWETGTYLSGLFSLIFGLIFWNLTDPLWIGIFRLLAFIFFSLAVFGVLKRLGGPLKIVISNTPKHLQIDYLQKDKTVQQEQFERSSIEGFQITTDNYRHWLSALISSPASKTLLISFNDQPHNLPLFKYSGRTLFFSLSTIHKVEDYLNKENITAEPQNAD